MEINKKDSLNTKSSSEDTTETTRLDFALTFLAVSVALLAAVIQVVSTNKTAGDPEELSGIPELESSIEVIIDTVNSVGGPPLFFPRFNNDRVEFITINAIELNGKKYDINIVAGLAYNELEGEFNVPDTNIRIVWEWAGRISREQWDQLKRVPFVSSFPNWRLSVRFPANVPLALGRSVEHRVRLYVDGNSPDKIWEAMVGDETSRVFLDNKGSSLEESERFVLDSYFTLFNKLRGVAWLPDLYGPFLLQPRIPHFYPGPLNRYIPNSAKNPPFYDQFDEVTIEGIPVSFLISDKIKEANPTELSLKEIPWPKSLDYISKHQRLVHKHNISQLQTAADVLSQLEETAGQSTDNYNHTLDDQMGRFTAMSLPWPITSEELKSYIQKIKNEQELNRLARLYRVFRKTEYVGLAVEKSSYWSFNSTFEPWDALPENIKINHFPYAGSRYQIFQNHREYSFMIWRTGINGMISDYFPTRSWYWSGNLHTLVEISQMKPAGLNVTPYEWNDPVARSAIVVISVQSSSIMHESELTLVNKLTEAYVIPNS